TPRARTRSSSAASSDPRPTGRLRMQSCVALPPAYTLLRMVGSEMRPQPVLALQRRRRDQMAHDDHVPDLQLAARPAAVSEPLLPFLQLRERGEQPLLAPDDANLLPHQAPQRVEQLLHVQLLPAIAPRLAGRHVLRSRGPALGGPVTGVLGSRLDRAGAEDQPFQ